MWKTMAAILVAGALALGVAPVVEAKAPAGKNKKFEFDGDDIEGALLTPDGEFLGGRVKPPLNTLIRYRVHFIDEMLKTAEDI